MRVTADSAERFLADRPEREKARLRAELERIDLELVAWQEHDADRALPLEYRRYPRVPAQSRAELHALNAALVARLTRLA